ncbi:hypothetical protein RZS08_24420, partial [Arthrospira platensis SPKY1]|nr:hypothetical protein [Arthrospira platensis SPKY1]
TDQINLHNKAVRPNKGSSRDNKDNVPSKGSSKGSKVNNKTETIKISATSSAKENQLRAGKKKLN